MTAIWLYGVQQAAVTSVIVTDFMTCDVHLTAMSPARVWPSMQSMRQVSV